MDREPPNRKKVDLSDSGDDMTYQVYLEPYVEVETDIHVHPSRVEEYKKQREKDLKK